MALERFQSRRARASRSMAADSSRDGRAAVDLSRHARLPFRTSSSRGRRAAQPRAVQDDPAVGRRDALGLTDGLGVLAQHLALEEDPPAGRRQPVEAALEGLPEAALLERRLGVAPGLRRRRASGRSASKSSSSQASSSPSAAKSVSSRCARSETARRCRSITLKRRIEVSQVRRVDLPPKLPMLSRAATRASCTASSASWASRSCASA